MKKKSVKKYLKKVSRRRGDETSGGAESIRKLGDPGDVHVAGSCTTPSSDRSAASRPQAMHDSTVVVGRSYESGMDEGRSKYSELPSCSAGEGSNADLYVAVSCGPPSGTRRHDDGGSSGRNGTGDTNSLSGIPFFIDAGFWIVASLTSKESLAMGWAVAANVRFRRACVVTLVLFALTGKPDVLRIIPMLCIIKVLSISLKFLFYALQQDDMHKMWNELSVMKDGFLREWRKTVQGTYGERRRHFVAVSVARSYLMRSAFSGKNKR